MSCVSWQFGGFGKITSSLRVEQSIKDEEPTCKRGAGEATGRQEKERSRTPLPETPPAKSVANSASA